MGVSISLSLSLRESLVIGHSSARVCANETLPFGRVTMTRRLGGYKYRLV